ncbi:hypothetical protein GRI39_05120 [Altererythrobacter indicus]|uniref:Uncharacterized protein n=2 Tax=Altericroceibacterium indicum TaxID=374177 RepID=A0A845A6Y0_9SPHN|nr:hypothetical protein [Altericroceibacterium indicum]
MSKTFILSDRAGAMRYRSLLSLVGATSALCLISAQPAYAANDDHIASLQITGFAERPSAMLPVAAVSPAKDAGHTVFKQVEPRFEPVLVAQNINDFDLSEMNRPSGGYTGRKTYSAAMTFDKAQLERREVTDSVLRSFPDRIAYAMPENQQAELANLPEAMEPPVVVEGEKDRVRWNDVKVYEYAFQTLNLIDAVQTVALLSNDGHHEKNPILGKDPSPIVVVGYKAVGGLLHYGMTKFLLSESPQHTKLFQQLSLAVQGGVVAWNMQFVF